MPDDNQHDRPGPPPSPASAMQDLEKFRLTQAHLANDSHCPICKDEYEVWVEVKVMTCKHFYHPKCIDPWLHLHNTCPVCRYELPVSSKDDNVQADFEAFRFNDLRDAMSWAWNGLFSLWPLCLLLNRDHHDFNFEDDNGAEINPCDNLFFN